ncbi:MAG TPA: TPM domain-containing protein [Opitutaceae bacterium]|nr:TPM domain-containing protein [Opitutaceae bacterium]
MRWLFAHPAPVDQGRIVAAIAAAEARTSGRIRVLLARHRAPHPVAAAQKHFGKLAIAGLPQRNGVLIFVAPRSRTFAVVGDRGVHEKCGEAFWRELASAMRGYFQKDDFTEGLLHGIERAGQLLAEHFPPEAAGGGPAAGSLEEVD